MLRNNWTDAWAAPEAPKPLGMPIQGLVTTDAIRRTGEYAGVNETQKVAFNPIGQVVGQINDVESCRNLVMRLINEYIEALESVHKLTLSE
jgi:NAD(P)H-dependent flavin oxidoreductase YrpB (nitropropane dioxygenase family)